MIAIIFPLHHPSIRTADEGPSCGQAGRPSHRRPHPQPGVGVHRARAVLVGTRVAPAVRWTRYCVPPSFGKMGGGLMALFRALEAHVLQKVTKSGQLQTRDGKETAI